MEKYNPKNNKKSVVIHSIDGKFIGEFDSVNKACKTLNLDSSTVYKILRGSAKSTKGYTIKYKI
ncbi:MAG: NUMOD1 domain-containing DNA-binding protein [Intestinibacter sp.]|uniref:NUMOD1 domain-containing DNA-binding protein n=1 Tax=Intestinibacter sp. TaxID=1965304 RepID=UPI003F156F05